MSLGFEVLHPGGMDENSPAFQRWDRSQTCPSPGGTADVAALQASLRDASATTPTPSVETLGYFRMSLRDRAARRASQILVTLGIPVPSNSRRANASSTRAAHGYVRRNTSTKTMVRDIGSPVLSNSYLDHSARVSHGFTSQLPRKKADAS